MVWLVFLVFVDFNMEEIVFGVRGFREVFKVISKYKEYLYIIWVMKYYFNKFLEDMRIFD